nr:positive effector of replication [Cloning vector pEC-K18mob2]AAL38584.1 positive effector of replication [Cloning vector pEC-T18mob2]AAO65192.1 Per [Shuttle expression vector pEC-XC99E]AAO65195.1 Per [Shuttle expression vector pEC-XK99E]AAO65200.1 Per [Shuttle expression vector pEC-XT99A]AAO65229.1 Per [Shuttle vector pEC-K19MECA2]AAO66602.1 Per [Shuttle vector pEC-C18mob2]AAO66605.1 Per [Shuttle vector pEC-K19mob2]AAO66608.1 Per [Shuttle vector pEC-S18mob2]AAO66611.1 Per [Shuttle vecto
MDLSDVALESDALDAAVDLKTVIGFFRALDTTDAPASRDWASAASDLETLVADLEELADELRARQRQEDAQ